MMITRNNSLIFSLILIISLVIISGCIRELKINNEEKNGIGIHFVVGPYTQNMTTNSITIVWRTNISTINNSVEYGMNNFNEYAEYGQSNCTHHEITIHPSFSSGYYKVISDDLISKEFKFNLADNCNNISDYKFVVIGDSRGTWDNWRNATEIAKAINSESPDFVIHCGDMVDEGRNQSQWDIWLRLMKPLMQNTTLFTVYGNHEYNGSIYYRIFALPNNEMWYSFDYGPCHFTILHNYEPWAEDSLQYIWLENDLSSSDMPFKIVCFHEPIYCSGGHSNRTDIRAVWEPLFNKYNVNLVFQAHCHYYQRINPINETLYIVTGAAGAPLSAPEDAWFVNISKKTFHYCVIDVSCDLLELKITVKDLNGDIFDEYIIK